MLALATIPNRRISARRACRLSVRYRVKNDWHPATAMDLSLRGARLRVGEDLERGTRLLVRFELPLRDGAEVPAVDVPASVIWSRAEGLSHQSGLLFEDTPEGLGKVMNALA